MALRVVSKISWTRFAHDDWQAHGASGRSIENTKGIFFSGIARQLQREVLLLSWIAFAVASWNGVLVPSEADCGALPDIHISSATSFYVFKSSTRPVSTFSYRHTHLFRHFLLCFQVQHSACVYFFVPTYTSLPPLPFMFSSPALGLCLLFRTNSS